MITLEETGGDALVGEGCAAKVAPDSRIAGGLHREIVMGTRPLPCLRGMARGARLATNMARCL
jgi:hypothetical protein